MKSRYLVNVFASALLSIPTLGLAAELKVVTSFSVLNDLVQEVGGEHISLTNLVEANGDAVIRNLGFSEYNLDTCAWALVVIYIGCLIVAFMGLSLTAAERGFLKMKLKIRAYNK